jgi:hypothetical protein
MDHCGQLHDRHRLRLRNERCRLERDSSRGRCMRDQGAVSCNGGSGARGLFFAVLLTALLDVEVKVLGLLES